MGKVEPHRIAENNFVYFSFQLAIFSNVLDYVFNLLERNE